MTTVRAQTAGSPFVGTAVTAASAVVASAVTGGAGVSVVSAPPSVEMTYQIATATRAAHVRATGSRSSSVSQSATVTLPSSPAAAVSVSHPPSIAAPTVTSSPALTAFMTAPETKVSRDATSPATRTCATACSGSLPSSAVRGSATPNSATTAVETSVMFVAHESADHDALSPATGDLRVGPPVSSRWASSNRPPTTSSARAARAAATTNGHTTTRTDRSAGSVTSNETGIFSSPTCSVPVVVAASSHPLTLRSIDSCRPGPTLPGSASAVQPFTVKRTSIAELSGFVTVSVPVYESSSRVSAIWSSSPRSTTGDAHAAGAPAEAPPTSPTASTTPAHTRVTARTVPTPSLGTWSSRR